MTTRETRGAPADPGGSLWQNEASQRAGFTPGTRGWFTIQKSVDVIHHDEINGKKAHELLNDEGKLCDPFMMGTKLMKIKIDGNFLNLIQSTRGKSTADRPE